MSAVTLSHVLLGSGKLFITWMLVLAAPAYVVIPIVLGLLLAGRRPLVWGMVLVIVLASCAAAIWLPYHFAYFGEQHHEAGGPGDIGRALWFLIWLLFLVPSFIWLAVVMWFRPR